MLKWLRFPFWVLGKSGFAKKHVKYKVTTAENKQCQKWGICIDFGKQPYCENKIAVLEHFCKQKKPVQFY